MSRPLPEWAEPGAFEVAPGVYRIPLPLPSDSLRAVNVYAIADGERVALVDSGWSLVESREQLARSLDRIGYGLAQVSRFLVTHVHRDHYTQAVALRREYGTPVGLGAGERPSIERLAYDRPRRPIAQIAQLTRCGAGTLADTIAAPARRQPHDGPVDETIWEPPDTWIEGGVEVRLAGQRGATARPDEHDGRVLTAIATPGHTRGHLVFLDQAAGLLLAGDHVLPHITPSIGFESSPARSPLRSYLGSLRLVRSMPDARLLPAHGPVSGSVHQRVDELLDHHGARLDATLAAVVAGADTAYAAAGLLAWTRRLWSLADLDPFNQMLAVLETGAHLDLLVERGALTSREDDGITRYGVA
jgi:glyoxylase-like metal-dependent hydrolase (beta-lactamase superfamily II)